MRLRAESVARGCRITQPVAKSPHSQGGYGRKGGRIVLRHNQRGHIVAVDLHDIIQKRLEWHIRKATLRR